jgi:hypothetical protein
MNHILCRPEPVTIPRPDAVHLEAAEGWLMLGDVQEASVELRRIRSEFQQHPLVLEVQWRKCEAAGETEAACTISRRLCEMAPDQVRYWICHANSLRRYRGALAAAELLKMTAERFPNEPIIFYNLACYLAQLGLWQESCNWLLRSFEAEGGEEFKVIALVDPDLRPLWENISHSVIIVTEEEARFDPTMEDDGPADN